MVPPGVGVYVSTLKSSALASAIGFVELTKTGILIRESVRNEADGLTILVARGSALRDRQFFHIAVWRGHREEDKVVH